MKDYLYIPHICCSYNPPVPATHITRDRNTPRWQVHKSGEFKEKGKTKNRVQKEFEVNATEDTHKGRLLLHLSCANVGVWGLFVLAHCSKVFIFFFRLLFLTITRKERPEPHGVSDCSSQTGTATVPLAVMGRWWHTALQVPVALFPPWGWFHQSQLLFSEISSEGFPPATWHAKCCALFFFLPDHFQFLKHSWKHHWEDNSFCWCLLSPFLRGLPEKKLHSAIVPLTKPVTEAPWLLGSSTPMFQCSFLLEKKKRR